MLIIKQRLANLLRYFFSPDYRVTREVIKITRSSGVKSKIRSIRLYKKNGVLIRPGCKIGDGISIRHFPGIIIGEKSIIGNNCIIYSGVVIGQNHGQYPVIGNDVIIYSNAVIAGKVHIGDRSVIGAGSIVLKDVPEGSVVAGNPARVVSRIDETSLRGLRSL